MQINIEAIFNDFEGAWHLHRTITPGGTFKGQAVFQKINGGDLLYKEQGSLTLESGEILEPFKTYLYKLEDGRIHVYFADGPENGKLFQRIGEDGRTEHLCGEDFYKSLYKFNLPDHFTIAHEVEGPRKDYVSESVFSR